MPIATFFVLAMAFRTSVLSNFVTTPHSVLSSQLLLTMPTKSKNTGKKAKGATVTVSPMKLSKKAARYSQVPAAPVQDLEQTTEERTQPAAKMECLSS